MTGKKISLNLRLNWLLVVCFVPLTVMVFYLLFTMNRFSQRYDHVVRNITKANEYNISFREELDYSMYIIVVNSERAEELLPSQPHERIDAARKAFQELYDRAQYATEKNELKRILTTLQTLENHVTEMEQDARIVGMYDRNLERLDMDIRILTELIQEQIQNYIYYETTNLENMRQEIREEVINAITVSLIVLGTILIIAVLFSRRIVTRIAGGISQLLKVTRKAGKGDFSARAELENNDEELRELGYGFNQMMEQIGKLIGDIKVEQLNLRMTEQKLLQAQINPHFLYNTLDVIVWLAEDGQTEQVVAMVTALSDFFRTTLSKGRDYITVREEESHIHSYLLIQQFRYQDILEYEIDIPQEMYQYQILKLTLQPLVENALYHGIKNKRGKGYISVKGKVEKDKLIFTVSDNGIGMDQDRLKEVRRTINQDVRDTQEPAGFGLYNVAQRIRLNYGVNYELWINSTYGEGTEAIVTIPIQKNTKI